MRRIDDDLIDPEIAAELDAIDATLAGDPVDPKYAEIAELALLLASDRPEPAAGWAQSLDQRVARRFAPTQNEPAQSSRSPRRWFAPLAGLATASVAAVVAVVVLAGGGGQSSSVITGSSSSSSGSASAVHRPSASSRNPGARSAKLAPGAVSTATSSSSPTASPPPTTVPAASAATSGSSSAAALSAPAPVPSARKITQSAMLALSARSNEIDTVAQEIFDVVGREHGVVNNSSVTQGANGSAQFQLSVPSASLQATMTALSQLAHATVTSRTDSTQDVNGEYLSDQRKLGDARALRTSLLKQLANATTSQQVTSLKAQIRDAEASISSDEATLRGLNHRIDFSQVQVAINSGFLVVPSTRHHSSSFTLGKAAHDAGRVLTVAAGVALITLAALVPVALIGALAWWIWSAMRRRRREQALDLA